MILSVAIPTLNPGKHLKPLIDSLLSQEGPFSLEILIADSASRPHEIASLGHRPIRFIPIPPGQYNHGATRNLMAREASGEIIAFLTQDALPQGTDYLANLVQALRLYPQADGAYARQIPRPNADTFVQDRLKLGFPPGSTCTLKSPPTEGFGHLNAQVYFELSRYDHVACATRREALLKRPLRAVAFGEDILWGLDTLLAGRCLVYAPMATVMHSHRRGLISTFRRTALEHAYLKKYFSINTVPNAYSLLTSTVGILGRTATTREIGEGTRLLSELLGQFMGSHRELGSLG